MTSKWPPKSTRSSSVQNVPFWLLQPPWRGVGPMSYRPALALGGGGMGAGVAALPLAWSGAARVLCAVGCGGAGAAGGDGMGWGASGRVRGWATDRAGAEAGTESHLRYDA